jgi:hypothetical protein
MSIEEFRTPFQFKLDKANRWVKLGNSLPWEKKVHFLMRKKTKNESSSAAASFTL